MPGSNTTSSGRRKKRSIEQWPGPLQFSDFISSDTVVGGVTIEEFLITVMDYYLHNKYEMDAQRRRQLEFFHQITREPKTTDGLTAPRLELASEPQDFEKFNNKKTRTIECNQQHYLIHDKPERTPYDFFSVS